MVQRHGQTAPHAPSIAVWDVPSPVVAGRPFTLKVGVTCSARCQLAQHPVAVRDESGATVGRGHLGAQPWAGTEALYWADVDLVAPMATGLTRWAAGVSGHAMDEAHDDAATPFTFVTVAPPAHQVTITVTGAGTTAPIGGADVRLGPYRAVTDFDGVATVDVAAGTYELGICADGYVAPAVTLDVTADVAVVVDAVKTLSAAEQDEQFERWEASQWG
ncbi:MAG: hypothetical protein AB7H93_06850 [Vicinamibacterales bacterium]